MGSCALAARKLPVSHLPDPDTDGDECDRDQGIARSRPIESVRATPTREQRDALADRSAGTCLALCLGGEPHG